MKFPSIIPIRDFPDFFNNELEPINWKPIFGRNPHEPVMDGFEYRHVRRAFEMVENGEHWKGPVCVCVAEIPAERLERVKALVEIAVLYFTATRATITIEPQGMYVKADGYWAGPAN